MESIELNGVNVPTKVIELAASDPEVNELLRQATSVDFTGVGSLLWRILDRNMRGYHFGVETVYCLPECQRQYDIGYRRASEERGLPLPPPFDARKHCPVAHVRQLLVCYELQLSDVADAMNVDPDEAADLVYHPKRLSRTQRSGLKDFIHSLPRYDTTEAEVDRMVAERTLELRNRLLSSLRKTIALAEEARKPRRGRRKPTPPAATVQMEDNGTLSIIKAPASTEVGLS